MFCNAVRQPLFISSISTQCIAMQFDNRYSYQHMKINYSPNVVALPSIHRFLHSWISLPTRILIIVWQIFGYSNIFEYFPLRIFVRIIFVSFFLIRIYSDIRSYCFFQYEYIRIFVRIKISYSSHYGWKWMKMDECAGYT